MSDLLIQAMSPSSFVSIPSSSGMGVGPDEITHVHHREVSIPSSSGMGVGLMVFADALSLASLNTFFNRYGCRTRRWGR